MLSVVRSFSILGVTGYDVDIEVDISNGMPTFDIVGLADTAVKESKERVRAAIKNSGFDFPVRRMTVNLAPAFVKKEGSSFDLPIAIGILLTTGQIDIPDVGSSGFVGELSLDGGIKPVNGVLPMALRAKASSMRCIFVPGENALEAAVVDGIDVYPAKSLLELAGHFGGEARIRRCVVDTDDMLRADVADPYDFSDVKGQEKAKRAMEIAASGSHNCLMVGPPGSGKTMLAKRLPSILPSLTYDESVEITMIHSVAGLLPPGAPLVNRRPFRNPLSSASAGSLAGGGRDPKPGEISLAHNGVLFLDELPEFGRNALDILRQPLEDGCVTISRVSSKVTYPARTTFICSANPCKCGHYLDGGNACTCTPTDIKNYFGKISGPLLDRIDMHIEVRLPSYEALYQQGGVKSESSASIRARVERTRKIQRARYAQLDIYSNAQLEGRLLDEFCPLDKASQSLLRRAYEKMSLSARARNRILKVARTIADMEQSEPVTERHVSEAIGYRNLDRNNGARI